MLPDPSQLRAGATALGAAAEQGSACLARVGSTWGAVCWHAPVADAVGRELAAAEAAAAAGRQDLEAGAAHLRVLAAAVEELRRDAVRLHDAAAQQLHSAAALPGAAQGPGALALAPSLSAIATAQAALAALPGPEDPSWAERAGAHPVALPARAVVAARPVAVSPPGLVEADVDGVRRLGGQALAAADELGALAARVSGTVRALPLPQLDAYGLAGSRSAAWLQAACGPGSGLARAASGWLTAGRRATLLAALLEQADEGGALLADPRLGAALDVLAQLRAGSGGPADGAAAIAWLAAVLGAPPGGTGDADQAREAVKDSWLAEHGRQLGEVVNDAVGVPGGTAAELRDEVGRLARSARAALTAARGLTGQDAADARAAAAGMLAQARRLRGLAQGGEALAAHLHVPALVTRLNGTAVVDLPVLRHLSWTGALGAGVGVVEDRRGGASWGTTAVDLGKGIGITLASGAVATAVVALLPVELAVGGEVLVGLVASYALEKGLDAVGPAVARAAAGVGSAALRAGADVAGAAGSALRGAAEDARPALAAAGAAVTAGAAGLAVAVRQGAADAREALETARSGEQAAEEVVGEAGHAVGSAAASAAGSARRAAGRLVRGLTSWRRPGWL